MKKLLLLGICFSFLFTGCSKKSTPEEKPQIYCVNEDKGIIREYYYNESGELTDYAFAVIMEDVTSKKEAEEAIKNPEDYFFYDLLEKDIKNGELNYIAKYDGYYLHVKSKPSSSVVGINSKMVGITYDEAIENGNIVFTDVNLTCYDQKDNEIEVAALSLQSFPNMESQIEELVKEINAIYPTISVSDFTLEVSIEGEKKITYISNDSNIFIGLEFEETSTDAVVVSMYLCIDQLTEDKHKLVETIITHFVDVDMNEINAKLNEASEVQKQTPDQTYDAMVEISGKAVFRVDYNFEGSKIISIFYLRG